MTDAKRPYESPRYSKGRVDRAGERIGGPDEQLEDLIVLENWRASHANILNTFKTILYNKSKGFESIEIVQRLKRRPTIIDKLKRESGMKLSRMHDIAGCRVIFQNMADLERFRSTMHSGRFDHERRGADNDRWNYVKNPKESGYRGIHDVYRYHVEPKKGRAGEDQPWNGMLVEIQYRTKVQHAWATAVELAGQITENNPKFNRGSKDFIEYFQLSSEMLARTFEDIPSCKSSCTNLNLLFDLWEADSVTHISTLFSELRKSEGGIDPSKYSLLIFRYDPDLFDEQLEIQSFDSMNQAIHQYNNLEKSLSDKADIVLVGSRSSDSIKSAYRNYFSDATEFLNLLGEAEEYIDQQARENGEYGPEILPDSIS